MPPAETAVAAGPEPFLPPQCSCVSVTKQLLDMVMALPQGLVPGLCFETRLFDDVVHIPEFVDCKGTSRWTRYRV